MLKQIKLLIKKPISKYLMVGATAFIIEYVSFFIMYSLMNIPLYVANSLSFGFGLSTSFSLNRLWTFGNKNYKKQTSHQLSFYVLLAFINLLLTNILVGWFKYMGINPKIGKIIAMAITSLWDFFLFKALIFTHKKPNSDI